jgi:hypothetical protein
MRKVVAEVNMIGERNIRKNIWVIDRRSSVWVVRVRLVALLLGVAWLDLGLVAIDKVDWLLGILLRVLLLSILLRVLLLTVLLLTVLLLSSILLLSSVLLLRPVLGLLLESSRCKSFEEHEQFRFADDPVLLQIEGLHVFSGLLGSEPAGLVKLHVELVEEGVKFVDVEGARAVGVVDFENFVDEHAEDVVVESVHAGQSYFFI